MTEWRLGQKNRISQFDPHTRRNPLRRPHPPPDRSKNQTRRTNPKKWTLVSARASMSTELRKESILSSWPTSTPTCMSLSSIVCSVYWNCCQSIFWQPLEVLKMVYYQKLVAWQCYEHGVFFSLASIFKNWRDVPIRKNISSFPHRNGN